MEKIEKIFIVLFYGAVFCGLLYYTFWGQFGEAQIIGVSEEVFMRVICGICVLVMILAGIWLWHEAKD